MAQWTIGDAETGEIEWAAGGGTNPLCIKLHEEVGWDCSNTDQNRTSVFNGHCGTAGGAHKTNFFFLSPVPAIKATSLNGIRSAMRVLVKSHDCFHLCLARLSNHGEVVVGLAPCDSASDEVTWVRDAFERSRG